MKKSLIEEYFDYQEFYEKKYGNDTVVFMEVGSFFEIYGIDNDIEKLGKVKEISEILNIQMTRRNKSISEVNRKNPLLAGIPTVSWKRYLDVILKLNKYTVVIIEQITEPPNPQREVTEILSPGTYIDFNHKDSNNLISLYIQEEYGNNYTIGSSCIDLSTGQNIIFETYSTKNDNMLSFNECETFVSSNYPKEIVIINDTQSLTKENLLNLLNIKNIPYHFNQINKEYLNLNYQETLLSTIFDNNSMLTTIELLDLEKTKTALNSYIYLLNFSYEHNPNIIKKIEKPEIWTENKYLKLANNSINQLNLISKNVNDSNISSVFDIINNTSTALGRRLLKFKLLNPIINVEELNKNYDFIEKMIPHYKIFENELNNIYDIERLQRKIILEKLNPAEFVLLTNSYESIINLINLDKSNINLNLISDNTFKMLIDFKNEYNNLFVIDEMAKHNLNDIGENFFKKGYEQNIDEIVNDITKYTVYFELIIKELNKSVKIDNVFKLDRTDKEGYYITISNSKYKEIEKMIKNENYVVNINLDKEYNIKYKDLDIKILTNNKKITFEVFNVISDKILLLKNKLIKEVKDSYINELKIFSSKYEKLFGELSKYVSNLDVIKSNAKTAFKYNYIKPIIEDSYNTSFIEAKQLRHPIVEIIENNYSYIPNDVNLGNNYIDTMLLYGVNAAGKSVYMKSVGISIILAQSGFYVPASYFKFKPFTKIYTRISGEDNIMKGLSSFAVEMTELRNILRNADENTLVLGDEISHGTETTSGLSIVSSAVIELSERKSKTIFATHLHELSTMEEITILKNVKNYHLKVHYDQTTKELIYYRNIEEGAGEAIYGLEVAKAMDLDEKFIQRAYNIRKKIIDQKILTKTDLLLGEEEIKKSKYNNEVIIEKCYFCDSNAEHSHHILEQNKANKDTGLIGHIHKNRKFNILPVCEKHHQEIHSGKILIQGFIKTSNGVKLDFLNNN